jgi:hypothetical protein
VASTQEDVLRFDVPVHHALLVRVSQRVGHFGGHGGRRPNRQPALTLESLAQRLALHVGHHEVRQRSTCPIVHHAGIEDWKDVRMLQSSGQLDLAKKPLATLPPAQLGTDHLEGD